MAAGVHLLLVEPGKTLDRLEAFEEEDAYQYEVDGIQALAHFALDDLDTARTLIRAHASEALGGRLSQQVNYTVLLLAALAHREGDKRHSGRHPPPFGCRSITGHDHARERSCPTSKHRGPVHRP
jgi:hypothetical protein